MIKEFEKLAPSEEMNRLIQAKDVVRLYLSTLAYNLDSRSPLGVGVNRLILYLRDYRLLYVIEGSKDAKSICADISKEIREHLVSKGFSAVLVSARSKDKGDYELSLSCPFLLEYGDKLELSGEVIKKKVAKGSALYKVLEPTTNYVFSFALRIGSVFLEEEGTNITCNIRVGKVESALYKYNKVEHLEVSCLGASDFRKAQKRGITRYGGFC